MKREAILVKTEDFHLVKEELDRLVQVTSAQSAAKKLVALAKYRMVRDRLLQKRDRPAGFSIRADGRDRDPVHRSLPSGAGRTTERHRGA